MANFHTLVCFTRYFRVILITATDLYIKGKAQTPDIGIMAATVGFNSDPIFDEDAFSVRKFIYIIKSKSGRFLPLLSDEKLYTEVDFVEGIAGNFELLGYQKLMGYANKNKVYKGGHFAVFL